MSVWILIIWFGGDTSVAIDNLKSHSDCDRLGTRIQSQSLPYYGPLAVRWVCVEKPQ